MSSNVEKFPANWAVGDVSCPTNLASRSKSLLLAQVAFYLYPRNGRDSVRRVPQIVPQLKILWIPAHLGAFFRSYSSITGEPCLSSLKKLL